MANPVWHTELNIPLDLARSDLGHPDMPGLWEKLYAQDRRYADERIPVPRRGLRCNGACRPIWEAGDEKCGWMYLRQSADGRREAVHQYAEDQARHHTPMAPEHRAHQERIVRVVREAGHPADLEVSAPGLRSDVLISGADGIKLRAEVQLSEESSPKTISRRKAGEKLGLSQLWLTHSRTLAKQSNTWWARTDELPAEVILKAPELWVRTGFRDVAWERCNVLRGLPCPSRRSGFCGRLHPRLEPVQIGYDKLLRGGASGEFVPIEFRYRHNGLPQRPWVTAADRDRLLDSVAGLPPPEEEEPRATGASASGPTCRTVRPSGVCVGGCGRSTSWTDSTGAYRCWRCKQASAKSGRPAGGCTWCGSVEGVRLYADGSRCPAHTPAALAGREEPGRDAYCPPGICWCGNCPHAGASRPAVPTTTVIDQRHVLSGKRRSTPSAYAAAKQALRP